MNKLFLAFLGLFTFAFASEHNKYNVLFIAIDDLRPELGCYGAAHAQSPNLDEFAKQAVLFDRHYVQVPTCGSSRFALLTGRSPKNTKALGNGASSALSHNYSEKAQTMPELFKRSGYKTACIGKISHQPDGLKYKYNGEGEGEPELPHAWDEFNTPYGQWNYGWGAFFAYEGGRHREDGKKNKDLMEFTAIQDTDLPDGLMAEKAIKQLDKWSGERFFIGLGFYKPHLPFVATKKDWDAFENTTIPNPKNLEKPVVGSHGAGEFYKYNAPFKKNKPLEQSALTQSRRAYLACVRYVDRQVGKVLHKLKELGLDKNTIIVIWGDHGWFLGDMQMWGKHSVLEEANRSVFMIKVPGEKAHQTSALASTIDIFPTLLDYCNPKDPSLRYPLDGVSQRKVITGEQSQVRDAAISYWKNSQSIRTNGHRLIISKNQDYLYKLDSGFTLTKECSAKYPDIISEIKKKAGL